MEKSVKGGIREAYYHDIIEDYQQQNVKSFLYRAFWADNVRTLLKECLPALPKKKELGQQLKELNERFLGLLENEENGPEQMKEHFAQLPKEVKELLQVHLPQLPEEIVKLLREHFQQLPEEVKALLERFPWLLEEEISWLQYESKIRTLLKENMLEHPEQFKEVLKKKTLPQKQVKEKAQEQEKEERKPGEEQEQGTEQKKQKTERRDFWAELWLNDIAYDAGLITDTEYYMWLAEYLAVRDIYYTDASMTDGHVWLYELLRKGLGRKLEEPVLMKEIEQLEKKAERLEKKLKETKKHMEAKAAQKQQESRERKRLEKLEDELREMKEAEKSKRAMLKELQASTKPEMPQKDGKNIRDKVGVGRDLAELAEKLQDESGRAEASSRLHDLKIPVRTKTGKARVDYLPWLTRRLERMAVHVRIKTWLQDNGYPLGNDDRAKRLQKECRKDDFSMRLFGAYCDSGKGYDFIRRAEGGKKTDEGWEVTNGFCVWKPGGFEALLQTLLESLEQDGREYFYLPLAVDLRSGCVFFLAGKGYYMDVYDRSKNERLKKDYENMDTFFCYDYLRLDSGTSEEPGHSEMTFRLQPAFHENAGKSYMEVLDEFKWYCEGAGGKQRKTLNVTDEESDDNYYLEESANVPRRKIKAFNEERPLGIPEAFWWAFDSSEDSEPSRMAREDFHRTQRRIAEKRGLAF